jgi:hypothetical protein
VRKPIFVLCWKRVSGEYLLKRGRDTVLTVFQVPGDPRWRASFAVPDGAYLWLRAKNPDTACEEAHRLWRERVRDHQARLGELLECVHPTKEETQEVARA